MRAAVELTLSKACSRFRKIVHPWPRLEGLLDNIANVWSRSQLLTHPYVQLQRGFVFIHITKTAGTSLNQALDLNAPLHSPLHRRARDVMPLVKKLAPNVNSISFVRNPYARFVSLYTFARTDESPYHSTSRPESTPFGKHPDRDILLDKSLEQCAELLIQGKLSKPGWNPQVEWLTDKDGNDGVLIVDFIGRVESLSADLDRLQKNYGIVVKPVPWLNKSSEDRSGAPQWTERARDLIRLYYKRDFELLGYEE